MAKIIKTNPSRIKRVEIILAMCRNERRCTQIDGKNNFSRKIFLICDKTIILFEDRDAFIISRDQTGMMYIEICQRRTLFYRRENIYSDYFWTSTINVEDDRGVFPVVLFFH